MTPEELARRIAGLLGDEEPPPAFTYRVARILSVDGLRVRVYGDGSADVTADDPDGVILSSATRRRLHALLSDEGLDRLTD